MNVDENRREWEERYHWADLGDEWSEPWGGPARQWHGSILPRLLAYWPARNILEIACGCGRFTQFLRQRCEHLVAVDLSERCIRTCRERFAGDSRLQFYVNDGRSLAMVPDDWADLVFSFDSLVHADREVMDAYIGQLPRILRAEGVAFLHHSNLRAYQTIYKFIRRIPKLESRLVKLGILDESLHWRDESVDAALVAELADRYDLCCIAQEIIRWRTRRAYNDCISVIVKKGSKRARPNRVWRNRYFMKEADNLLLLSQHYT